MVSFVELVTADPAQLEPELVRHFTGECSVCKGLAPKRWYNLCTNHAFIVRAIVEPPYLEELKARTAQAQQTLARVDLAVDCKERIEKGERWLREEATPEQRVAGEQRLADLHRQCPPRYADYPIWQLLEARGQLAKQIKFYESRLQTIHHASSHLARSLARAQ